ncbi:hypothetical protein FRB94_012650 [Tulasnella sp. JGI-2019a]|nr:hypothetical protein FRB93_001526 [Tulasnella sp. JGI-2019a]KAG9009013.1 hypothetical protein FRB94_012650 [Tulasnella sp. JGI-2019a]KAG9036010.1 hypothetical protein FRB95_010010 [Tulasnella sp. JGI-2019a]
MLGVGISSARHTTLHSPQTPQSINPKISNMVFPPKSPKLCTTRRACPSSRCAGGAHCLLCHHTFDAAANSRTCCRVPHTFNSWNRVRDLATPKGTTKWVYFAICGCPAIKTVTELGDSDRGDSEDDDDDDDDDGSSDVHTIITGGAYCFVGPHVANPSVASRFQNGLSMEECETRGCHTAVPAPNPAMASTYARQWFEGGWFMGAPYTAKRLILPPAPASIRR